MTYKRTRMLNTRLHENELARVNLALEVLANALGYWRAPTDKPSVMARQALNFMADEVLRNRNDPERLEELGRNLQEANDRINNDRYPST